MSGNESVNEFRGVFLLATVVLIVALSPLWFPFTGGPRVLIMFGFLFGIGFGGYLVAGSRYWLYVFAGLVFAAGILAILEHVVGGSLGVVVATQAVSFLIYGATISVALRFALFAEGVHPLDRVIGGIAGYFLLGLAWVHIYNLIIAFDPAAISVGGEGEWAVRSDLLYYSLVTLTTQGYGEIVPVNPFARMAAALQGVVGTLYIAILIASLVSELRRRGSPDGGN